ncbi:3914_t:CDS:1 [Paraglomus brasilianum]|uniref:3914_t:CDS:1 n=1 Tax=Paraglomus brasilianum TaxID=144538 RepID=A0A9N9CHQ7_9GLOM|nr:3914_t:CDS:1 [Paraglomus brasilianum]
MTISKLNNLPKELKVEIASYIPNPFFLGCCSRDWYNVVNSAPTQYKWILNKYGRIHALFHAVRIGKPLLNSEVAKLLLKYSHISRHFIQRLKLSYGQHVWGNNISNDVYEQILNFKEGYKNDDRNDMQSIRQVLEGAENENVIKIIIETYGFTPFPPSPIFRTYIFENSAKYEDNLPQNGYATASELKIVAKAIITYPNLLNVWRKIGYHEITNDLENPVVQLTLLNLYSTSVPSGQAIAERLCDLQSIGFPPTDTLIGNALLLFTRRLNDVGDSLVEAFCIARKMSKADILDLCLIELLDPARNLEHNDVLDYIVNLVDNPEKQILSAFEKYSVIEGRSNLSQSRTSLKYTLVVYQYMLRFGAKSPIVRYLMKEIIIVHTWLTDTGDIDKLRDADTILDEYYTANVPFDRSLLPLFKKWSRAKPIGCLFEGYLPALFGFEVQHRSFSAFQIPEVGVLTSPTQTEELQRLWLEDIQKCVKSEELVNDEFTMHATEFFTRYRLMHSCFDH